MTKIRRFFPLAFIAALIAGVWLFLTTDSTYSGYGESILLVLDNTEVRHLISAEEARNAEYSRRLHLPATNLALLRYPEKLFPEHVKFVMEMARQPTLIVNAGSYATELRRSEAPCGRSPIETAVYIKIRIMAGHGWGSEGWMCDLNLKPVFSMDVP